jgi:methylamine dehydrogenase accessory protein MauD
MSSFVDVSIVLIWVLLIGISVLVLLLYRQFGLLYLGSGKRVRLAGLRVGSAVPHVVVTTTAGELDLGRQRAGTYLVLLFGGPLCSLCEGLLPQLETVAQMLQPRIHIVFIDEVAPNGRQREIPQTVSWSYAASKDGTLHRRFDVEVTPFAFLVGPDRRIVSKNLVNRAEDILALIRRALGDVETAGLLMKTDREVSANGDGSHIDNPKVVYE